MLSLKKAIASVTSQIDAIAQSDSIGNLSRTTDTIAKKAIASG
jgi:hypothetical protein